jgi:hypothetical protein
MSALSELTPELGIMSNHVSKLLNQALNGEIRFVNGDNQSLNMFGEYLMALKNLHCKKVWSDEYKSSVCFRRNTHFSSKEELTQFCRVSLFLANEQISELISSLKENSETTDIALINSTIVDYIFDLKNPIEHLERHKKPDFILFDGRKSHLASSIDIFRLSISLLNGKIDEGAHKTRQIAAVCVLRQSLESRFRRIIGVELHDIRGNTPKLKHHFHCKFISENQDHISLIGCNLNATINVYEWCNDIVHGAYQPFSWQLPFAHQICAPLFYSGDNGKMWSIHGSAHIRDVASMRQEFLMHFANSYDHGTWCVEFTKPDALTE